VLRLSGTSRNIWISLVSPKLPVAGSPLRLNATAPTWPGLRDNASAFITAAWGSKTLDGFARSDAVVGENERPRGENVVGRSRHGSLPHQTDETSARSCHQAA
jgi:hypothetical protein